jgi:hypothetical protein
MAKNPFRQRKFARGGQVSQYKLQKNNALVRVTDFPIKIQKMEYEKLSSSPKRGVWVT